MKTKTGLNIRMLAVVIIEALILQCFCFSVFAEMPPSIVPGKITNTVVWETSLKPVTGKDEILQFVCTKGTVNEDTYDKGKITSTEGKFELRLTDAEGKILSVNDKLFDFEMEFHFTNFDIIFDDYNNDNYADFTIGQASPTKQSGWVYKIYTVKNNQILELPVKGQPYIFTNEAGFYDKPLAKSGADSFKIVEYDGNQTKECVIKTYKWGGKQFTVSDEVTQQLVSDKNKGAEITDMVCWPQYGVSLYSVNKPRIGNYKGYKGYYLYVRGNENYYPNWESNYPAELHSISSELDYEIFTVHLINSDGTSYADPTIITFNAENMSFVDYGPEYYYYYPPGNDNNGQMVYYGGALVTGKNTDVLLMINGKLVSDINTMYAYGDVLVPLYQINNKLGLTLNNTKIDVPCQIVDNVAYVPLRSVAEVISAEYGILNSEPDRADLIFPYDLAWFDTQSKSQKPTYDKDKALEHAKSKLQDAFAKYKPTAVTTYKNYGSDVVTDTLNTIKSKIDGMKYVDKASRYLVFDGPYRVLIDEYTGDIYFQQWTSAGTGIVKADFSKPISFDLNYFYN